MVFLFLVLKGREEKKKANDEIDTAEMMASGDTYSASEHSKVC